MATLAHAQTFLFCGHSAAALLRAPGHRAMFAEPTKEDSMLARDPSALSAADLDELVRTNAGEGQTLEFKQQLPGTTKDDKFEFAKDVCAMLNATGGDIVYGIAEARGAASKVMPLTGESSDAATRRLLQVIDTGIEPRPVGIRAYPIPMSDGYAMVIRVPAQMDGPYRVTVDDRNRFPLRNNTHTTELTYDQLRSAFDRTATLAEKAARVRDHRIEQTLMGRTWQPMMKGPVALVQLIPLMSMSERRRVDVSSLDAEAFRTKSLPSLSSARNLDGLVGFAKLRDEGLFAYVMLYRNGALSSVRTARMTIDDRKVIPSTTVAAHFRDSYMSFLKIAGLLNLSGPAIFSCAVLNTDDYAFGFSQQYTERSLVFADRSHIVLPELWIDRLDAAPDVDVAVKPILDVLWEAFDMPACTEYDTSGMWRDHPP